MHQSEAPGRVARHDQKTTRQRCSKEKQTAEAKTANRTAPWIVFTLLFPHQMAKVQIRTTFGLMYHSFQDSYRVAIKRLGMRG